MIDILIHEFGPNRSLNVIIGNEKIDATAVLEFLTIANYKFTFFVNSRLQMNCTSFFFNPLNIFIPAIKNKQFPVDLRNFAASEIRNI